MPLKFTTAGRIELWRGTTKISDHLSETAAVSAAVADWEAGGDSPYELRYPNKTVEILEFVDTTPPSTPAGLRSTARTNNSITLAWDASTD